MSSIVTRSPVSPASTPPVPSPSTPANEAPASQQTLDANKTKGKGTGQVDERGGTKKATGQNVVPTNDAGVKDAALPESLTPELKSLLSLTANEAQQPVSPQQATAQLQGLITEGLLTVPNTGGAVAEPFAHPLLDSPQDVGTALAASTMATVLPLAAEDSSVNTAQLPRGERGKRAIELARAVETFFTKGMERQQTISAHTPAVVVQAFKQQMDVIAPIVKRMSDQAASAGANKSDIEIPSQDVVALEKALAGPLETIGSLGKEIAEMDPEELSKALEDIRNKKEKGRSSGSPVSPAAQALAEKLQPISHSLRQGSSGAAGETRLVVDGESNESVINVASLSGPQLPQITASFDESQLSYLVLFLAAKDRKIDIADRMNTIKQRNAEKKAYRELKTQMRDGSAKLEQAIRAEYAVLRKSGAIPADVTFDQYKAARDIDPGQGEVVDGNVVYKAPSLVGPPPMAQFAKPITESDDTTGDAPPKSGNNKVLVGVDVLHSTPPNTDAIKELKPLSRTEAQAAAIAIHKKHPLDEATRKELAAKFGIAERDVVFLHSMYNALPSDIRKEVGSFEQWLQRPMNTGTMNPSDPKWRHDTWAAGPGLVAKGAGNKEKLAGFMDFCDRLGKTLGTSPRPSSNDPKRFDDGQAWLDERAAYLGSMSLGQVRAALGERLALDGNDELKQALIALGPIDGKDSLNPKEKIEIIQTALLMALSKEHTYAKMGDPDSAAREKKNAQALTEALTKATRHISPDCRALLAAENKLLDAKKGSADPAWNQTSAIIESIFSSSERPSEPSTEGFAGGSPEDYQTLARAWVDNNKGEGGTETPGPTPPPTDPPKPVVKKSSVSVGGGFDVPSMRLTDPGSGSAAASSETTTMAGYQSKIEDIEGKLDSISDLSEMDSLRLQQYMDQYGKLMSTISNMMKQRSDGMQNIIGNMK